MAMQFSSRRAFTQVAGAKRLCRSFSSTQSPLFADRPSRPTSTGIMVSSLENDMNSSTSVRASRKGLPPSISNLYKTYQENTEPSKSHMTSTEMMEANRRSKGLEKLQVRKWKTGDVYSPRDLSAGEMRRWRNSPRRPNRDVFDILDINPLNEWKNFALLTEFMTPLGRIKHPRETGLRPVNQRKIAKAIRRAVGMGFHPSVHVHPELLRRPGPWQFE